MPPYRAIRTATASALALLLAGTGVQAESAAAAQAGTPPSCPLFRWTTLGTAGGPIPTFERAEPSNLLEADDQVILVDAGDAAANQMIRVGREVGDVRSVFISHFHIDHTGGLGAVVGLRWMREYPGAITVYGPPGTVEMVNGLIASIKPAAKAGFGLGLPSNPADRIKAVDLVDGQTVKLGKLTVRAVANNHLDGPGDLAKKVGALAFSYRFEMDRRAITYTGDTGPDPRVTRLAAGSNLLVSEVIEIDQMIDSIAKKRPELDKMMLAGARAHFTDHHLTPAEVGRMAAQAGVGRVVMTHLVIPGELGDAAPSLFEKARAEYAGPVDIARDLSSYDVGCGS